MSLHCDAYKNNKNDLVIMYIIYLLIKLTDNNKQVYMLPVILTLSLLLLVLPLLLLLHGHHRHHHLPLMMLTVLRYTHYQLSVDLHPVVV